LLSFGNKPLILIICVPTAPILEAFVHPVALD
jgi:hypothetical protein